MGRLQNIASVHIVVIGIPIGRVARFHVVQHGLQHAGGNLKMSPFYGSGKMLSKWIYLVLV